MEENVAVGKSCSVKQKGIVYTGIVISELMICCTVNGCTNKPALPKDRLDDLKKKLISLHPEFRNTPVEFGTHWKGCTDAINHACSTLQMKALK